MMKCYDSYVNKMKFYVVLILLMFLFSLDVAASDFYFVAAANSRGRKTGVNEKVLSALMNHLVNNEKKAEFLLFPGDMISGSTESAEKNKEELLLWKQVMSPVYENPYMA